MGGVSVRLHTHKRYADHYLTGMCVVDMVKIDLAWRTRVSETGEGDTGMMLMATISSALIVQPSRLGGLEA